MYETSVRQRRGVGAWSTDRGVVGDRAFEALMYVPFELSMTGRQIDNSSNKLHTYEVQQYAFVPGTYQPIQSVYVKVHAWDRLYRSSTDRSYPIPPL